MKITPEGVTLEDLPATSLSLDIAFDGERVWSIDLAQVDSYAKLIPWPAPLGPFLTGHSQITVADPAQGSVLLSADVAFSDEESRVAVVDPKGRPLAINKWGYLAPELGALDPAARRRLLESTTNLIAVLEELGFRPFVVGGTLLGAVRDGALLPHDDDADVAFLSEHTNPLEVAVESFELGKTLAARGFEFVRHSAAHIQVIIRDAGGDKEYHVDIFSAFFTEDGYINQPFHVRGMLRVDQMLPFSTVTIDGHDFPAPADPEGWLVINYDENWRTPIPGYQLVTPRATERRFYNWFGSHHLGHDFWNQWHMVQSLDSSPWSTGEEWLSARRLSSPVLLELGAGSGALSRRLSTPERRVIATDFSQEAIAISRDLAPDSGFEAAELNLNQLESINAKQAFGITGQFDVIANHVLDELTPPARSHALRIIRSALRSGGSAFATAYGMHSRKVTPEDPTTWHLSYQDLAAECSALGILVSFHTLSPSKDESGRRPYGAHFTMRRDTAAATRPKGPGMRSKIEQVLRRTVRKTTESEIDALRRRVEELEQDLDDQRRDSLRVAEMLDLLEQRLSPEDDRNSEGQ